MGTWIDNISEYRGGAAKYIVFENDAGVYGNVVLDFDVIADSASGRYNDILPNIASLTDFAIAHDMAEVPYLCVFADGARLIDAAGFVRVITA